MSKEKMTDTPEAKAFREKYGLKKKPRERMRAAIREEMAAGNILLDTLERVNREARQIQRGFGSADPVVFLKEIEDDLQSMIDEMDAALRAKHNIHR